MISRRYTREFCCEDISRIENYEQAISDRENTWDCHHRNEICEANRSRLDKGITSKEQLIADGMYYNRPACELIFLRHDEHIRLHSVGNDHNKGKPCSSRRRKLVSLPVVMNGERTFPSQIEAARWLRENGYPKASPGSISHCCLGDRKSAYGATWAYAN